MKLAIAAAAFLGVGAPGTAQVSDPLAQTTDPADRAVMAEAASAVADEVPDIARLDAVLAKLPRPTPLRGLVQIARANALAATPEVGSAVAAVEDALRLLPDDPRPKIVAAGIYTYTGAPQRAADLWLRASRESPEFARMSDRYSMMALIGRLTEMGDRARADQISARLGEIGFSAGLAPERSHAALAGTREAIRGKRESDARLGVTSISNPDDLLTLYVDRRYAVLWPRIAEWAGPGFAAQGLRYLEELRGDWADADDFETAAPYARRLASLDAHPAVVSLFLPMFERLQPGSKHDGVEYLAPVVARSLARMGRRTDARALLIKAAAAIPAGEGSELNIDGAYVTLATLDTDWPQVIAHADTFLARAGSLGSNINRAAVTDVQSWRACALSRTGRIAEAQLAVAEVSLTESLTPGSAMQMYLCRGDGAGARAHLVKRLADETTRGWALRFVQPVPRDAGTPLARLMEPFAKEARTAPEVVTAAKRVGRILPTPINAVVPSGFDPFRVRPRSDPPSSDET